jgi:outer membrane immunogenic protein
LVLATASGGVNPSGWFGGGQIGYNAQFNALVLGLEADLQGADISELRRWPAVAHYQATTDIEWFSTLRGRVGYAAGPALLYVTGGLGLRRCEYQRQPSARWRGR